jgi:transposase
MPSLPDLTQLSAAQKDELIRMLWPLQQQVLDLTAQVLAMQAQIAQLQGRLNLNSQNSSKPPSSDGLHKPKPKSQRKPGERTSGGQKGHPGRTLSQVAEPDWVLTHAPPEHCDACQRSLGAPEVFESRQVFDLPTLAFEVTEHRVLQAVCTCGKTHRGQFPESVAAAVQYGPAAQAAMVHLNQHHMVPLQRTATLMGEFFGLSVSEATVLKASLDAAQRLTPTVRAIAQAFLTQPTVHADETGLRVGKALHWMHVLATEKLTWVACHFRRGGAAFDALGILPKFKGTLIHDGWKPYRALACSHGLCNVHHLRELTYVFEEMKQDWAGDMIELLTHANHLDNANCANGQIPAYAAPAYRQEMRNLRGLYEAILDQGDTLNPRVQASGKRGATKQSKPANLINRLREYADDVWRFMAQPDVPFTNNIAEQAVRMPKVKQKVSGCFRTTQGADTFCLIRSYLATMHKQGANLFESLVQTFRSSPPQPSFG